MEVIFSHEVIDSKHRTHWLEICVGDATESHAPSEVDVLAISCFENSYAPTRGTMVKSLIDRGVNVAELSKRKAIDELARWQCWISESLVQESPIGRILCFEHGNHRDPQSVVGNVFRMVSEFALGSGGIDLKLLRLPLLSTGNQGADKSLMLESIIRQAYNHLRGSLPVAKVQIVLNGKSQDIHRLVFESGLYFHQIRSEWHAVQMAEVPAWIKPPRCRRITCLCHRVTQPTRPSSSRSHFLLSCIRLRPCLSATATRRSNCHPPRTSQNLGYDTGVFEFRSCHAAPGSCHG